MDQEKGTAGKEKSKRPIDILKESVGGVSKDLLDRYKEQNRIMKMIRGALSSGPRTVPELSTELGITTNTVFWYLMAMRKYGEVIDEGEKGSYVVYALSGKEESSR